MTAFNEIESAVLNTVQQNFPLTADPYDVMAKSIGVSTDDVLASVQDLRQRNIIRNISGIFNPGALGYHINLVAMKVPEDFIDTAADIITSHPGVSHNYLRDHELNIWFTLAETNKDTFDISLNILGRECRAEQTLVLKNERRIKIGMVLQIGKGKQNKLRHNNENPTAKELSAEDIEAVKLLQHDVPVTRYSYREIIEKRNSTLTEERFFEAAKSLQQKGVMRRYGAVLRHVNAGFTDNAMTVWKPEHELTDDIIQVFENESAITHLYLRTVYPGVWEYPLFAMIHGRSTDELNEIIHNLSHATGITDYMSLKTLKEFKKERVTYLTDDFDKWRKKYD